MEINQKNLLNKVQLLSQLRYKCLTPVFLEIDNCSYAVIKGEPLSFYAYKKTGKRISSDIDILIPRKNIKTLEKILEQNNFQNHLATREDKIIMLTGSHQVAPWIKIIGEKFEINVDINFDIFWGEYTGKPINIEEFIADTVKINVYGLQVKTLPPLKAMVQLILHHYKEMNSIYHLAGHNCINYNMFKDVYYLWRNNQEEISLDKLYTISNEYKIIPYVFYVLYFTNQIFKDSELEKNLEAFKTVEGIRLLDYYGLDEREQKLWKVDFATRLNTDNLFDLIKDDLTEADIKKLERNRRIFG